MSKRCWAACLGTCGGGASREHLISASQFDSQSITISGFPWCPTPTTVGLASLVAKNLCRSHNSALSPVDTEAARFKRAIKEFIGPHGSFVRRELDARLIERWLLKTTINLVIGGAHDTLDITEDLVRIAFGQVAVQAGQGFFFVAEEQDQVRYDGNLSFESLLLKETRKVAIASFAFHGCRLIYAFTGAPPVRGAFRLREWNRAADYIRLIWKPELVASDTVMPERRR